MSSESITERSAKHLMHLRGVYRKNPALIDEFVRGLNFDCHDIKRNQECDECGYASKPDEISLNHCCIFCDEGEQKLKNLIKLLKAGDA